MYINDNKWLITGVYNSPSMKDDVFTDSITKSLDQCIIKYDNYMVLGDTNYDMSNDNKSKPLYDICDIFYLSQLISSPTCFKKGCIPSLVDVILTNKKNHYVLIHITFQLVLVIVTILLPLPSKANYQHNQKIKLHIEVIDPLI